jgi:hypothetical protein
MLTISASGTFLGDLGIHADAVWGGLIGGVTVCAGVLLAEWFARKRELTFRFDDAYRRTMDSGRGIFFPEPNLPLSERASRSAAFKLELALLHNCTRYPVHNYKEIKEEVEAIFGRFDTASKAWLGTSQTRPVMSEVMGDKIGPLFYRSRKWWVV